MCATEATAIAHTAYLLPDSCAGCANREGRRAQTDGEDGEAAQLRQIQFSPGEYRGTKQALSLCTSSLRAAPIARLASCAPPLAWILVHKSSSRVGSRLSLLSVDPIRVRKGRANVSGSHDSPGISRSKRDTPELSFRDDRFAPCRSQCQLEEQGVPSSCGYNWRRRTRCCARQLRAQSSEWMQEHQEGCLRELALQGTYGARST
eukprot:scaffold4077_cov257-Pinguiococcus_pyrenoidosus.AAC.5